LSYVLQKIAKVIMYFSSGGRPVHTAYWIIWYADFFFREIF